MSRSRKKVGVVKDKGCGKAYYNRKFRKVNKHRLRMGQDPLLLSEVVNDYWVCDYVLQYRPINSLCTDEEQSDKRLERAYYQK